MLLPYCMVQWMAVLGCRMVGGTAMKFCANCCGPGRMNHIDFADPLTFPLLSTSQLTFMVLSEMSQHLLDIKL